VKGGVGRGAGGLFSETNRSLEVTQLFLLDLKTSKQKDVFYKRSATPSSDLLQHPFSERCAAEEL